MEQENAPSVPSMDSSQVPNGRPQRMSYTNGSGIRGASSGLQDPPDVDLNGSAPGLGGFLEPIQHTDEFAVWVKTHMVLPGFVAARHWKAAHDQIASDFLNAEKPARLFAAMAGDELFMSPSPALLGPAQPLHAVNGAAPFPKAVAYFVCADNQQSSPTTATDGVQYGVVSGPAVHSLLRLMNGVYAPKVFARQTGWPESVKKELTAHFHKFMASLVETSNQVQGKTVLYLPSDLGSIKDVHKAAKDKDLVQHLESIVIHWTRQIKDVVNNHDNALNAEILGPLEEIEFWRSRTLDLSSISDQLARQDVRLVVRILEAAKSSYLGPFEVLSQRIQEGSTEANNNLKFLHSITEPCQRLAEATPKEIPALLPHLLNCIRVIWTLSRFYNTEERLTGLLRKISNEIIHRCCAAINLDDIFDGNVEGVTLVLNESRACGVEWKEVYRKTAALVKKSTTDPQRWWDFDDASTFAQIDAFVQRCSDLLEVCEGQIQFARKSAATGGMPGPLPEFGGTRGQEITKALLGIQASFESQIERLRGLDYELLDVKTSRWHDDYNAFKNVVKDLEVMYTRVISTAFEGVSRIVDAIALLEIFYTLARREAIKQACLKKTADVYMLFIRHVEGLRHEFDKKRGTTPPLRANEPQYAGSALWAHSLARLVDSSWTLLKNCKYMTRTLTSGEDSELGFNLTAAKEAEQAYAVFITVIADFKNHRYQAWVDHLNSLDSTALASRLDVPLLRRATPEDLAADPNVVKQGHLICNFNQELLALFTEVSYWEKFQGEFSVPYVAHDICSQREKLRAQREHVMLVVRAYNDILNDLTPSERKLFSDHIRRLDKRIHQGMSKLTWSSKGIVEYYVRDCCTHAAELHVLVKSVHQHKEAIGRNCRNLGGLMLIKIDKNTVYDDKVFSARQAEHCVDMRRRMQLAHENILNSMREIYAYFKEGTSEVKREWRSLVSQTDKDIEAALRQTVKKSLQELSRAINGDAKTEPQTLFKVNIVLEGSRVDYRPTMINLTHAVNIVAKELISTITVVPRLKEALGEDKRPTAAFEAPEGGKGDDADVAAEATAVAASTTAPSFYSIISNDEDTLKILVHIMNGMSSSATELQKYLSYWDKYKYIWEHDKEGFIRKYAKANRGLGQFDQDITRYRELQTDIQQEEVSHTINFINIDCTQLKTALVGHCVQWQGKLTGLLNQNAMAELKGLHEVFRVTTEKLRAQPQDLDRLSESVNLLDRTRMELPVTEGKFGPLEEMYAMLAKFEVQTTEEELSLLAGLRQAGEDFKAMIHDVEAMLNRCKVNMKRDLETSMSSYNDSVLVLHKDAMAALPYSSDLTPDAAFELIMEYKKRVESTRKAQTSMQAGLDVFNMDIPEHAELKSVERDLDLMDQMWTVVQDWGVAWDSWKNGLFRNLNMEDMEAAAGQYNKKIGKLGREIKSWKVWESTKEKVEQFRQTMPLIQDLKNPALRERHWDAVRQEVGRYFDPNASDFNLEAVFSLGLHQYAEFIGELSTNANKELAIEQGLAAVAEHWKDIDIDMGPYKEVYYKIKSTDDLFQVLEDDSVQLSTIKASKFYNSFADKIDYWEATLNTISEVVEMILSVQKKWMYLESIFMASEDICKQLPTESALFQEVYKSFSHMMERIYYDPNAKRACCTDAKMLDSIMAMDGKLEQIQKSLDQYLETKRMVFPRFYFVSDDDLLEILGQSRDPQAVQKHLKKCFEGIKEMHLIAPLKQGNKTWEASGLVGPDGETVELAGNLAIDGPVELWLVALEGAMKLALQKLLAASIQAYKSKKEKWVKDFQGQLLISTGAVQWTADCSKALNAISAGNKSALKQLKKKQVGYLNKLSDMVRGHLTLIERSKLVALITMEIHNRDVMERMSRAGCVSTQDFEWLSQCRFVFNREEGQYGMCVVRQTNSQLEYSYEYQGNNGRLVVTPLTDRCVLTLTTAMYLHRGGNPLGPAGTGKTETVKDLGKNLAKYVVVINCSDGQDYKSVGRVFSGLVQSGSWGCFDEFNRIKIEVISVVAMQVLSIVNALSAHQEAFVFMGNTIKCNRNCGIFITMNPGYAGRTELPDNLKALMRPVAMMTPDLAMIAEVMLAAEGFREARTLAKKTVTLYSLMTQQLSKQDHYDYGLRNLKAVLNMAGALKRADAAMNEEAILMRALRDMNQPKFIKDDERLFRLLLGDLFPSLELPISEYGALQVAIETELESKGLQKHPFLISKIIQLYDSKLTRHCNMLVGRTMAGKSVAWRTLMNAKSAMHKAGAEGYQPVTPYVLNPKSITLNELYGNYDLATFEWSDGILSTAFKQCAESERPDEKWILFDGPVDALWIESMNSVMDDNKILTLINGDRIPLTNSMSLLFEVEDLAVASPATVSRAGMIFLDVNEMGWKPFVTSWLDKKFGKDDGARKLHEDLFEKYVDRVLEFKELNCQEPVPIGDFNAIQSLCALYDSFTANPENGLDRNAEGYNGIAEKWFVFSMVWSVMAAVNEEGRRKLDNFLRDIEAQFPPSQTVYDYFVDTKKKDWELWDSKVPPFRYLKTMPFHRMIVPTVDTVRSGFILNTLVANKRHTLLVGASGTGKTVLAFSELSHLPETHSQLVLNFSATTDSGAVQNRIESVMEKRSKDKLGPSGGKQLLVFIDDFNMPRRTSHESPYQPPLELLRFWMDYGGWYDREKCAWRYILDSQLVCAMAPPGGARAVISARTQSRFNLINLTFPSDTQVIRIFDSIVTPKLAEFENEIKPLGSKIAQATLKVYQASVEMFLPTPVKSHYLFNIRDVAKVIEGLMQATPQTVDSKDAMLRMWTHECQRVFSDRFVLDAANDQGRFRTLLGEQLKATFDAEWSNLFASAEDEEEGSLFTGCLTQGEKDEALVYEEVPGVSRLKQTLEERLEDYNMEPKLVSMHLVLFKDAVRHIQRIHRALCLKRGNLLLVGVGGSGRQSLTRLATYIAGYDLFSIEIKKNYRLVEFREDIKALFDKAGIQDKPVTFLFNDNQIKEEGFLEDINNILQSGEVPNLYGRDELPAIFDGVRKGAKAAGVEETAENLWKFFVDRVRNNLHVVLAMSPIGEGFRNRTRMYPGLVNCTTMDWFHGWPPDALIQVATKFIADVKLDDESVRPKVAAIFSVIHTSVVGASDRMLLELKRHNYVTPTNYLELVKGYCVILRERKTTLSDSCNKLRNGLEKLEGAREQVETMSVELEKKKVVVAQAQKDCEELLVEIVSERRVADEQKKQVEQESEKIGKEEAECAAIADDAQADLNVAMPALEKAMAEVEKLDKNSITEVKAYKTPPPLVETVLSAVMTLFGKGTDWNTAKKVLGEGNFLAQVKGYNKDAVSNALMTKIKRYVAMPEFTQENVNKVSSAAAALCVWVNAIYVYSTVFRDVAPKRARLKEAQDTLAQKQAGLKTAKDQLAQVIAKVDALKQRYDSSVGQKNALMEESQSLQDKLERADKLVSGLAGEYTRWQASIGNFEAQITKLVGDSLIAAGFLSYAGPFDTVYRNALVAGWLNEIKGQEVPHTEGFSFANFLAEPTDVRAWNIQGLLKDEFSTENGVMVTRGSRWPLMIDPQGQANKWIKNMEAGRLRVVDLHMKDYLRELGNCITYGLPCLLQDVLEELDPALEPVLSKAIIKQGNREFIRLGDKELDWSKDFRLYITTKLGNPHFTPEVSTKTTVVNFSVKQQGLKAQLLGIVVQKEQPALEEQSSELTVKVAAGKKKLVDLENEILRLLSESKGSLLDDLNLVNTLQQSKTTSEEVTQQLLVAEDTAIKIDAAREGYRPAAVRAAVAYFVLNDLTRVDPMYQFSLDAYVDLFNGSIESSRDRPGGSSEEESVAERCTTINTHHTLAVYQYTCRGLFERHKLLFSLQLCFRVMGEQGKIPAEEFNYFLYGGVVVDRSDQRPNPCKDWVDELTWDNITELDKLPAFNGLAASFEQAPRDWKAWFLSSKPEETPLVGDWDTRCSDLQRLCVLRALRPDRVLFSAASFVSNNLGPQFADPPAFDLKVILSQSTPKTPLIFVLSPGVDPTAQVQSLAAAVGVKMDNVALGQGQAPTAIRMIQEGALEGNWVFLANCHLMLSWMADLEKIVEGLCNGNPHKNFRLWLSSAPNPKFPIAILQRGVKMTTEPPSGIRANMLTLYNIVSQEQFSRCQQQHKYKKLLFSLCWFHAVLLERRKFKSLGFNIPYDFNESDFSICHDLIIAFLDEYPDKTPFDAMRYLIAEANYGGRVTDDWDRRLVNVYINQYICPAAIEEPNYPMSERKEYFIPPDGDLPAYKEFIKGLPKSDHPGAFGQHPNADIASLIEDTNNLFNTMISLAPESAGKEGESDEIRVLKQAESLQEQVPPIFNMREIRNILASRTDPDPMKTVLLQEAERYNELLTTLHSQLKDLKKAVQGLIVVTPELEEVTAALLEFRVPRAWGFCYPSLKPLGSWMRDLVVRCDQVQRWAFEAMPKVFWLPGMTYPTGFLTALLQTSTRKNGIAIDTLSWEFAVINQEPEAITTYPKDGAYCDGMFLEGARWNRHEGCLEEPAPMELYYPMPIIHFKPVESKKKAPKGVYACPIYMYPVRTGTRERPSFVIAADLKAGKLPPEAWAKRGAALLLSVAV